MHGQIVSNSSFVDVVKMLVFPTNVEVFEHSGHCVMHDTAIHCFYSICAEISSNNSTR